MEVGEISFLEMMMMIANCGEEEEKEKKRDSSYDEYSSRSPCKIEWLVKYGVFGLLPVLKVCRTLSSLEGTCLIMISMT